MNDDLCCGDIPENALRISDTYRYGDRERLAQVPRSETRQIVMPEETDVRGWRVWWSDGTSLKTFSSKETTWENVPEAGVQVIVVYFEREWKPGFPYRRMIAHADWYEGWSRTLTGTLVDDAFFDQIMELAEASETF